MTSRIVVGITGASGAVYARRVMELLAEAGVEMHLTVSSLGRRLLFDELGLKRVDPDALTGGRGGLVTLYKDNDVGAAIASGSFVHDGMVIVPCSANTLGAIASGLGDNLVRRAAAVALKERRRLILGYREMPASHIDVCNMKRLGEAGAVIAPLAPGFYLLPKTIEDLVDFVAGRILDLLGVAHALDTRWEDHALHSGDA
jgi:4-hydroxy-3-polyprenylbenzoate decarboxylase